LEDKRDKIREIREERRSESEKARGFSMIEVLLALCIGGLVLTCGHIAVGYYFEGLGGKTCNAGCI